MKCIAFVCCHFIGFEILTCLLSWQSYTFWNDGNIHLVYICWYDGCASPWWFMNGQNKFYYWVILTHKSVCCLTWHAWTSLYNSAFVGVELMDVIQSLCSHWEAAAGAFWCRCGISLLLYLYSCSYAYTTAELFLGQCGSSNVVFLLNF